MIHYENMKAINFIPFSSSTNNIIKDSSAIIYSLCRVVPFIIPSHFLLYTNIYAENCSPELNNESGDEFVSKLKSTNSSFCLLRHNRTAAQRGSDRSSSGASNLTFNFSSGSGAMQDKSVESTALTSSTVTSNRSKMVSATI